MKRIKLSYVMFDPQPTFAAVPSRWHNYPKRNFLELDKAAGEGELGFVDRLFSAEQAGRHLISCQWGLLVKVFYFGCRENSRPNGGVDPAALFGINAYSGRALPYAWQPYDSGGKLTSVCNRPHDAIRPKRLTLHAASDGRRHLSKIHQATLGQHSANDEFLATCWICTGMKFYAFITLSIHCFNI
jgi:hypothetical protein